MDMIAALLFGDASGLPAPLPLDQSRSVRMARAFVVAAILRESGITDAQTLFVYVRTWHFPDNDKGSGADKALSGGLPGDTRAMAESWLAWLRETPERLEAAKAAIMNKLLESRFRDKESRIRDKDFSRQHDEDDPTMSHRNQPDD